MFQRIAPEQHDTLDGIPEPAENPSLFGHGEAADALAARYRAGRLPHGLILSGPVGIGKATLAFHLANHLLSNPAAAQAPARFSGMDAGSPLFRQVATGAHPSVLHLTRPRDERSEKFRTVITVDEIRRVTRFLERTSHDGSYRVVIVDPIDDLNASAANALLKKLEEPPGRTLFLLVAHVAGRTLPTIRSRCQIVRLAPLDEASLQEALAAVGLPLPKDDRARQALLSRAAGSVRGAIDLLQGGGQDISDALETLVRAPTLDVPAAHKLAEIVAGRTQSERFALFNAQVGELLARAAGRQAAEGERRTAGRLAQSWSDAARACADAEAYNLDRKQHALTMIGLLHEALKL